VREGVDVARFLAAVASFLRRAGSDDCEVEEEVVEVGGGGGEEEEEASFFLATTITAVAKRALPLVDVHDKLPPRGVDGSLFGELKKGIAAARAIITRKKMRTCTAAIIMPWAKSRGNGALIFDCDLLAR
jgi:hypothetical protein